MFRFRRIMYTSSGSGDPGGASLTRTTDAAGFGTAGVVGASGLAVLMSETNYKLISCATRSRWYVASPNVNSDDLARLK